MKHQAGFTLVEMLLSIAIITIVIAISVPVYQTFVTRNDLDIATQTLAASLRRAETYARATRNDSSWSVEIQSTGVTLFQGTNFAGRNTAYDETASIPGTITPSGLGEIQFAKFATTPNTTGTITLTSTNSDTRTVTINAKGVVTY